LSSTPQSFFSLQIYPWPTIDLIVPSNWKGKLKFTNSARENTGNVATIKRPAESAPLIVLPFDAHSPVLHWLNTISDSQAVSVPNLEIYSVDSFSPVYLLGIRGGKFKSITMNAVTGLFACRDIIFDMDSKVEVSLPKGDVILNTANPISTNLESLYSATAPVVVEILPIQQPTDVDSSFNISIDIFNFRNLKFGDVYLSLEAVGRAPQLQDCPLSKIQGVPVSSFAGQLFDYRGLDSLSRFTFICRPRFTDSSSGQTPFVYNIILQYFGGTIRLPYSFQILVDIVNSVVKVSNLFIKSTNTSPLPTPSAFPNNLCAVGAREASSTNTITDQFFLTPRAPKYFYIDKIYMHHPSNNRLSTTRFACNAARSLSLGSHRYSYGNQPSAQKLGSTPCDFVFS
jgi:hypothetical protein